jgi:hypothetical protein
VWIVNVIWNNPSADESLRKIMPSRWYCSTITPMIKTGDEHD